MSTPDAESDSSQLSLPVTATLPSTGLSVVDILNKTARTEGLRSLIEWMRTENDLFDWKSYGPVNDTFAVGQAKSGTAALTELVTNAFDANIQLAEEHKGVADASIPKRREAFNGADNGFDVVADYYGMESPPHQYRYPSNDNQDVRPLVALHGRRETGQGPTVDVCDHGAGVPFDQIEDTMMDLMSSNKIVDPLMFGRYGCGRAAALRYADASLMITNSHRTDGVAVIVMRQCDFGEYVDDGFEIQGRPWMYAVLEETGYPPVFEVDPNEIKNLHFGLKEHGLDGELSDFIVDYYGKTLLKHGTIVRHTDYELTPRAKPLRSSGQGGPGTLYRELNRHLPGPPHLSYLEDYRIPDKTDEDGNPVLLDKQRGRDSIPGVCRKFIKQSRQNRDRINFDSGWVTRSQLKDDNVGDIRFRMFVLNPDVVSHDSINQYLRTRYSSGAFMVGGQKHAEINRNRIQREVPHLAKHLAVFVDGEALDDEYLYEIMQSNRDGIAEGALDRIHGHIIQYIRGNARIQDLNQSDDYRGTFSSGDDDHRDVIADANNLYQKTHTSTTSRSKSTTTSGPTIHYNITTEFSPKKQFLEIVTSGPKKVRPGRLVSIGIKTSIPEEFFYVDGEYAQHDLPDFIDEDSFRVRRMPRERVAPERIFFRIKPSASPGEEGTLTLHVEVNGTVGGHDTLEFQVVPPSQQAGARDYVIDGVQYVHEDDQTYETFFIDETDGEVFEDRWIYPEVVSSSGSSPRHVRVYVREDHDILQKTHETVMSKDTRQSVETADNQNHFFKHEYLPYLIAKRVLGFFYDMSEDLLLEEDEVTGRERFNQYMTAAIRPEVLAFRRDYKDIVPDDYEAPDEDNEPPSVKEIMANIADVSSDSS